MDNSSGLQSFLTPDENALHPSDEVLSPLFSLLFNSKKTIAPWIETTFWSNMLNKECYIYYFQELFKDLVTSAQSDSNPDIINSYVTTIFHLVFSFHNDYPKDLILPYYSILVELKNQDISHMLICLEKNSSSSDFANVISRFNPHEIKLYSGTSIPIFTLFGLLHQLRASVDIQNSFLSTMIDKIQVSLSLQYATILLHLIKIVVTFFDLETSKLAQLKESLYKFYCLDSSVSEISSDIIHLLDKSTKYPGYGFYILLNQMSQISEAFGCKIPLFFNAKQSNTISALLYNDTVDRSLYMNAYISYPKFFIYRYFNCQPPTNMLDLQRFMFNLKFSKKYLQTVPQSFKLAPADPRSKRPVLTVPVHQFQFHRIIADLQMSPEICTPYNQRYSIISSPIEAILNQSFFAPIAQYFKSFDPNNISSPTEQQMLIIGSDNLLSTIITTIALWIIQNPSLSFIDFQIYFVPIGHSQFGEFISQKDILYNMFVRKLYHSVNYILPTLDETSKVFFPKFTQTDGFMGKYENNIWFSNPSPSHIFQFGIQHYLMFAQNKVDIFIWQCLLTLADSNKVISVPFIESVVIDTNDQKRYFETAIIDYRNKQTQNETIETKTLSLYNANCEKRANPNNDFLILDTGSLRLIFSATISTPKAKPVPFFVEIDERKYGPVTEICAFGLDASNVPGRPPEQMRMKIKTFVEI